MMLALGDRFGAAIWSSLDEMEVKQVSAAMARLGPITPQMLDDLLVEFVTKVTSSGALTGNLDTTERLLMSVLPPDKVATIMEEIRGPAGRNMWEKLSNVQENVLANYLKNEYPQTVAVVLSKIRSDHAARVLSILPEEFALEVVNRMLRMESVQKDILDKVEQTLRVEFMSNLSTTSRRDSHELMAEIFNKFDRTTEARFLTALEDENREAAERIKTLMFTFDDLAKLDAASIQTMLRSVEKDKLALALKGSNDAVRDLFFQNMSARAATMLKEDMEALGPVRLRDVDEAQSAMINTAKDLAARGEIMITKNKGEDELVY
ncbi:Flagellar motor switch protein FliG [Methylobrevis pamukkalensis]|uniref:Flagellar motor switch protein FliG n=1 Tax=Methylobrevis pamukkalensis TaxID=1439726 RepID=A0A1E3H194_9HYPH|nr:Flagellar motor switch protein FliG [Methylobrevis pamukkalensis]